MGRNITKLEALRRDKEYSLNELYKYSGVAASYISAIEKREKCNPSIECINKLATALNVKYNVLVDDLLNYKDTLKDDKSENFNLQADVEILMDSLLSNEDCSLFKNVNDIDKQDIINKISDYIKDISYKYM